MKITITESKEVEVDLQFPCYAKVNKASHYYWLMDENTSYALSYNPAHNIYGTLYKCCTSAVVSSPGFEMSTQEEFIEAYKAVINYFNDLIL